MPHIDIVVTTYNRSKQIIQTLQSVLDQTDDNYTLYVLDNCSTDDTAEVCASFLTGRHEYRRNAQNLGMVGNWNEALKTGTSQYVQILHDDDELHPEFVHDVRQFLMANPDVAFLHTGADFIDDDSNVTGARSFDFPPLVPGDDYFKGWLNQKVMVVCPSAVFNRDKLPKTLTFSQDLPFTADIMFFVKASGYGAVGYIRRHIFRYRHHIGSTTASLRKQIDKKINDRQSAALQLQAEVDQRDLDIAGARTVGTTYKRFALNGDILFTRLLDGSIWDVLYVTKAVVRADPGLLKTPRFYQMLGLAIVPAGALRGVSELRKTLMKFLRR